MEIDSNKDGKPDQIFWDFRLEIDTDLNGTVDQYAEGPARPEMKKKLEEKLLKLTPLSPEKSWYLNPDLIPKEFRTVLAPGTGY